MIFGVIPTNLLEAAFLAYLPFGPRDGIVENDALALGLLPVRVALWAVLMVVLFPVMWLVALTYAIYARLVKGTAADILKSSLASSFKTGASYPCIFVFKKAFKDEARLTALWEELAQEVGMNPKMVDISFEKEIPKPFPKSGPVEADHFIDRGYNPFKRAFYVMKGRHSFIQVYNAKAQGQPTVMRCYFPGHTFDGTSCFNFGKELIARYYGERNEVVVQTELVEEAAEALRSQSFAGFLLKMPLNIFRNTSDFTWMFATTMRVLGGPGMSMELAMVNLDEDDSSRLVAGLKRRGIKPFAGFIYTAFHAYKEANYGAIPYSIVQQASMQSRSYAPAASQKISLEQFRKDRRYIGDWLIGCLHHFKGRDFSREDAMDVYNALLENLNDMKGNAVEAAMGKAYCPLGGAAVYQFFPFLSQDIRVMDGIFFNNYGIRDIHPEAELVSYNWGAPFRMGFNTLAVNGKICTCLASSHICP